ncbi:MAG: L-threonine 3-dehydrogenase [Candidatus Izemoplasmatales bacterium]|uniref:L-threonine 3-dehydrogenase n=1 Tax=Hujiaoplasma nucleasis TaxID=2725268 RepID=A0A7L6N3W7_9MOLU|nr:L-threonine 3-dehydrogenase [Hujiaoplasma nucleasis]QLY39927.1 L-threonine 3-dehydrogenase [Hujiaoplasma nucleasis]
MKKALDEHIKELEMMAVVKEKPEKGFVFKKVKISTDLKDQEVLIKIKSVSFCGTDSHIYNYDHWAETHLNLPLIVGHEFSGEIIKMADDVKGLKIGDVVSAETHIICNECEFCLRGEGHICENTEIIGVDRDGCFARYIKIPAANCIVNNDAKNDLYLSVQEPLGNAVHTVTHFDVKDKSVVILGCGPIGLMGIDVAKAYGAKQVIAIEVNEFRQNLAKELDADLVINPINEDVYQKVMEATHGKGVDVVCDFSGNKGAIELAFKYIKAGGGMSLLGLPNENISIDLANDVVFKGLNIYGVVGRRIYETWDKVKYLVSNDLLHFDKFVTHQFPLSQISQAAEVMNGKNCGKIILIPGDDIDE